MALNFDLQLFAEGEDTPAPPTDPESAPAGGTEPQPPNLQTPAGTILGGAVGENHPEPIPDNNVPEAYDFKDIIPEGMEYNEEHATAFSAVAKECGLTQEQASKLAAYGMKYAQGGVQAAVEAHMAMVADWAQTAKAELGGDYDKTVAMAARGIRAAETKVPGIRQMLDETGAGNRIEMIRMLAELGALTGEDSGHTGGGAAGGTQSIYENTNFKKYAY